MTSCMQGQILQDDCSYIRMKAVTVLVIVTIFFMPSKLSFQSIFEQVSVHVVLLLSLAFLSPMGVLSAERLKTGNLHYLS